jgi:hypothetical protein
MSNLIPSQAQGLDFTSMMQVSQMLAKSSLVPSAYRGKPENVLLATLAGQPFGWDPTMSMRSFHIIEGQPSLKPEIMLALVRRAGHSVQGTTGTDGATVTGKRRDTGDSMTVAYTLEDARRANLLNKSVWKQYPASMCWARALSQLCRMLFPDVVLGVGYTPEELGASVSSDGEVIEATIAPTAALPVVTQTIDAVPSGYAIATVKRWALTKYQDAGFDADEAKLYASNAWKSCGLADVQGPELTDEQHEAFCAAVEADLGAPSAELANGQDDFAIEEAL